MTETFTQASWKKALEVFEARLTHAPIERDMKLWYWKGIVARVHSEFAANLPEPDPPSPPTEARLEPEVRVEGPQRQSITLPPVREWYG